MTASAAEARSSNEAKGLAKGLSAGLAAALDAPLRADELPGPILRPAALDVAGRVARTRVGLGLAALILTAWLAAHIAALWFLDLTTPLGALAGVGLFVLLTWLSVGLFIVAHDAMHGALAPGRPHLNRRVGGLCLALYAGFSFRRFLPKHREHHRHPGTHDDPDFDADHPFRPWPWFKTFMAEYLGWRELLTLPIIVVVYGVILGERWPMVLLFWALPSILASFQLFYFGTYLPHRREEEAFADGHRTRSNDYSPFWSLITCFHFGYHHEHHLAPSEPWWRLPAVRRARLSGVRPRPLGAGSAGVEGGGAEETKNASHKKGDGA